MRICDGQPWPSFLDGNNSTSHLVKSSREEVEGGHDGSIRTQTVLTHDFLVIDGIPDINIGSERHRPDRWIQVEVVSFLALREDV